MLMYLCWSCAFPWVLDPAFFREKVGGGRKARDSTFHEHLTVWRQRARRLCSQHLRPHRTEVPPPPEWWRSMTHTQPLFTHNQISSVCPELNRTVGKQWLRASQHNTLGLTNNPSSPDASLFHSAQSDPTQPKCTPVSTAKAHRWDLQGRKMGKCTHLASNWGIRCVRDFSPHFSFQYLLQAVSVSRAPAVHAACISERPTN
jgi:hypothetical protein